jgi:hypothetical protein
VSVLGKVANMESTLRIELGQGAPASIMLVAARLANEAAPTAKER